MKRIFVLGFTGILLFISNDIYSQSDTLEGKFTQAEFNSATRLLTDWGNLLRISTAAGNIILDR